MRHTISRSKAVGWQDMPHRSDGTCRVHLGGVQETGKRSGSVNCHVCPDFGKSNWHLYERITGCGNGCAVQCNGISSMVFSFNNNGQIRRRTGGMSNDYPATVGDIDPTSGTRGSNSGEKCFSFCWHLLLRPVKRKPAPGRSENRCGLSRWRMRGELLRVLPGSFLCCCLGLGWCRNVLGTVHAQSAEIGFAASVVFIHLQHLVGVSVSRQDTDVSVRILGDCYCEFHVHGVP